MRLAGSDGVAAMILFYGQFLFVAFYLGFAIEVTGRQLPMGQTREELRKIYRISFLFTVISSIAMTPSDILAAPIVSVFTRNRGVCSGRRRI